MFLFVLFYLGSPHRSVDGLRIRSYVNPLRISDPGLVRVPGILCPESYKAYCMHIIPEFSHRASLADLQLICKPTVRLCNQRL